MSLTLVARQGSRYGGDVGWQTCAGGDSSPAPTSCQEPARSPSPLPLPAPYTHLISVRVCSLSSANSSFSANWPAASTPAISSRASTWAKARGRRRGQEFRRAMRASQRQVDGAACGSRMRWPGSRAQGFRAQPPRKESGLSWLAQRAAASRSPLRTCPDPRQRQVAAKSQGKQAATLLTPCHWTQSLPLAKLR